MEKHVVEVLGLFRRPARYNFCRVAYLLVLHGLRLVDVFVLEEACFGWRRGRSWEPHVLLKI